MPDSPCPNAELVLRYTEGDLLAAERERIESHVDACPTCTALVVHAAREVSRRVSIASVASGAFGSMRSGTGGRTNAVPRSMPERIGRYLVLGCVGAGGMGTVWSALDPRLQRVVAVKLMKAEPLGRADERLMAEARALARLSHPNVVEVFEVGREPPSGDHEGGVYLVMELVEGETLRVHARRHADTPEHIVAAYVQAAHGLAAAHACGIVHRDFKPDNAIVGSTGRVRVLDFGLARSIDPEPSSPSFGDPADTTGASFRVDPRTPEPVTQEIAGTPPYMAPEQLAGDPADARSDQYAYCVALWEALSGARPRGEPGPRDGASRIVAPVRRALRRGLRDDPARRFSDMTALVAALGTRAPVSRRAVAFAGIGALGLGLGLGALEPFAGIDRCAIDATPVTEVWDAELARGIDRQWATPERDGPTPARDLSRWVDRWLASRTRLCEAGIDVSAEAAACLRDGREQFRAVVSLFGRGEARDYAAWDAVRRLPDPERCAERTVRASDIDPRAAAVRDDLAHARALRFAARPDGALAITRRALDDARALDDSELVAAAMFEHAVALGAAGESRITALEEAYHRAEAVGLDALAAEAAAELVFSIGVGRADVEGGERWARHAQAAIDRLPAADRPAIAATLATSTGNMWMDAGRWAEARLQMERALELIERAHGPDHPLMVLALNDLGTVTRDSDPPTALAYFERSLQAGLAAYGEEHPDVALALGNIGAVHENQGDAETALGYLERAKRIAEAVYDSEDRKLALAVFNVGVAEEDLGDHDAAIASFSRALGLWAPPGTEPGPFAGLAHVHLGKLHLAAGDLDLAAAHDRAAIAAIAPAWGDDHAQCSIAWMGLAEIALRQGDPASAIDHATKAEGIQGRIDPGSKEHLQAAELLRRAHAVALRG